MATTVTWLGHNCWHIDTGDAKILLDPFLSGSPTAPVKADAVEADVILLSHGHGDHVGDTVEIAKRTGAAVITNFEIGEWLKKKGVDPQKITGLNPGGGAQLPCGQFIFTIAHHSSSLPDGSYGGVAGGFVVKVPDAWMYFACDTTYFLDMKCIGSGGLDLAVLPIGGTYTMGPDESIEAVKLLNPRRVAPCHYNTFPPIKQDPMAWAAKVRKCTSAEPIVLEPGGQISL
jgi:L-ascorbate metabolism protein UlaG (beta-lactamase superfamily)